MPLFSLVIPTLRRADTLAHALRTLVRQVGDVEIVVQNNGDDPETRRVVDEHGDSRVRHFSTPSVVSMVENWEHALGNATGEWITFVGDDDGLLPDACAAFAQLDVGGNELVTWLPFIYLWPQYQDERRRNRLEAEVSFDVVATRVPAAAFLERFYRFDEHYSQLPMVYNAFVRRSLVDRVVAEHGAYFLGSVPDVTSGIVNAAACDTFVRLSRPLSVWGVSRHSTGHLWARAGLTLGPQELGRDFPRLEHGGELPAWNFEFLIASEMQLMRSAVLHDDPRFAIDPKRLVRYVAAAINNRPDQYDETVDAIRRTIAASGLRDDDVAIPPRLPESPVAPHGVVPLGPSRVRFVVDGEAVRLRTIDDAVLLASQLVPATAAARWEVERSGLPALSESPLSFASDGDGRRALVDGWSEGETWGTWGSGRESVMRFDVEPESVDGDLIRLGLRYRVIAAGGAPPLVVECSSGRSVERWELGASNYAGELVFAVHAPDPGRPVELTFAVANPRSPAELGLGPDARPLGLGVEQLRVVRS